MKPAVQAEHIPLFKLESVSVEGASSISDEAITAIYHPYIGTTISQADLEAIAGAISNLYRDAGYHLSRAIIPQQDINEGHLRIQIIEGEISEIQTTGGGTDKFGVEALLNTLVYEYPAQLRTLERKLLLINDTPGVRIVDTALEEIGVATGRFRLIVKLETWRIFETLGLDNLGTHAVGPLQAYSTTFFNSYFIQGDTLGFNLSTVPNATQELRFGRLSYDVPVGTDGIRIGTTASYSEVWPDDGRRLIDTRTVNQTYELRGSIAPIETRQTSLTLTAAFGFTDEFEKDTFGTTYNDHIRTVRLLANYRLQDQLDGSNYFSVGLRQGVSALGATQSGDPFSSRDGASPNFSVLDFSYIRYQKLSDAWSIKTSVSGQFGSGPLYSSQAFYLGGAAFGPGYYSGDDGIAGLAELRFDKSVESAFIKSYQLYGFVDGGQVWNRDEPKQSLASIGVGVRLRLIDELHAGIAIAAPLTYTSRLDEFRQSRILFSLSNTFKFCPDRAQMRCF